MEVIDCIEPGSRCVNANPQAFTTLSEHRRSLFRRGQIVLERSLNANEFNFLAQVTRVNSVIASGFA